jgi:type IV pilus assembly protein PilB
MYQGDSDGNVPANGHVSNGHAGGLATVRLGDYLVQRGVLTSEQLTNVLDQQRARSGALLGQMLVHQGVLTEEGLASALAEIAGVPYRALRLPMVQDAAVRAVPRDIAPRYGVVPVAVVGQTLQVATADPFDILAVDELERRTGLRVQVTCATETDIRNAIDHFYGGAGVLENLVSETVDRHDAESQRATSGSILVAEETVTANEPIVRLVDELIEQAVRRRATDMHIDPEEDSVRIRYRVDGLLQAGPVLPKKLHHSIISRLKVIASLDIAEQRLPQEGHITYRTGNREVDLRVSCFPTVFGEKMAVRVLERQMLFGGLQDLGLESTTLAKLEDSMLRTKGIVLLTGPTGSGKTTTLYTMLSNLDTMANNIVTLEDPVEYRLPQIRQSQINNRAGFTFATGIRSMLRQDPDVILLGEIRDPETAGLAMRAALTGILVMSTLHTNEAAGTFPRLIDMGLEPYLIGSTVISAVAERLVRRVCTHCAESVEPDPGMIESLGLADQSLVGNWLRGAGCRHCGETGYNGRTGIFEILMVSEQIREAMKDRADTRAIRQVAVREGMQTLMQHGLQRVLRGETTLEELARVARE